MLKNKDNIQDLLKRVGPRAGMTVPDGYFADFESRMASALPANGFALEPGAAAVPAQRRTAWQRMRPFVYMAAMFAGVWCMMKMFSMMSNTNADLSIESNPVLLEALSNERFVNDYILYEEDDYELLEDIYDNGVSVDELTDSLDSTIGSNGAMMEMPVE